MIMDALLRLSNAQALTASAPSTNTIDLANSTPKRHAGTGEPMCLMFQVAVAAIHDDGDETYEFRIIQSDNADLSSPDVLESRIIAAADLTTGSLHYLGLAPGKSTKRYLGAYYQLGGTTPSVTVTCQLQPQSMILDRQDFPVGSAML